MTASDTLRVRPVDIDTTTPGRTTIASAQLATRLVRRRGDNDEDDPLQLLQRAAPTLTLQDISVDDHGRVVIESDEFRTAISDIVQKLDPHELSADNGVCGFGCDVKKTSA